MGYSSSKTTKTSICFHLNPFTAKLIIPKVPACAYCSQLNPSKSKIILGRADYFLKERMLWRKKDGAGNERNWKIGCLDMEVEVFGNKSFRGKENL